MHLHFMKRFLELTCLLRFISVFLLGLISNGLSATEIVTDSDTDGMDDAWEVNHFGSLSRDGAEDYDGDTLIDVFEFELGLDPESQDSDGDGLLDWMGITGYLSVQKWEGITGSSLNDLLDNAAFYGAPTIEFYTPLARYGPNLGDDYGARMRGTIKAPVTGDYTFWLSGDDDCEFYISTDSGVFNKRLVASVSGWTGDQNWDKYLSQQSLPVSLKQGQKYYIEVLHKEKKGGERRRSCCSCLVIPVTG